MNQPTRRQTLKAMGLLTLASSLQLQTASANDEDQQMDGWLTRLYENSSRLRNKEISSLHWQEAMDEIYASVPLEGLRSRLEFERQRKAILDRIPANRGELFHRVVLPGGGDTKLDGKEPYRTLITKVAHIKKGRSIPPHGHSNMASAFLCISGEFSVRLYDKLGESNDDMVLRQTVENTSAGVGTWSSISDYRDNVHWLTAKTDDCFLFTCKLIGVEQNRPLHGRINVDVLHSRSLGQKTIRAPKITSREAAELY